MSTYKLSEREIRLNEEFDVIVSGGGPAGCTAAAAAARAGAKTLLLEASGYLGGMGTGGLVPAWCPFTDKEKIIYGGLAERVLRTCMENMPHLRQHLQREEFDWRSIDSELLKRAYDDLMKEFGVTVLFNAFTCAVEATDGSVDALVVASKAGLTAYKATTYVDCTGDADIATWAGGAYEKGDETGDLQPASLCFQLSNVDMYAYQHTGAIRHGPFPGEQAKIWQILDSGKYPEIPDGHACNSIVGPGTVGFNAGHVWEVDNTDPYSVSKGLTQGRKIAKAFRDACAEFFPEAFGNAWLAQTAPMMGIRETRRIIGDYVLTVDDFQNLRSFDDEICRNCYFVDVHHRKCDIEQHRKSKGEPCTGAIRLKPGESHGIPYRCLTPKGLRNVLVAGRSISTDRPTQGSTRVMPVCLAMGEAAGMAAAMSVAHAGDVRAIDVQALRDDLRRHGAYLP